MIIQSLETPPILNFALQPITWKFTISSPVLYSMEMTLNVNSVNNSSFTKWSIRPDGGTTNEFTFDVHEVAQDILGYDLQDINKEGFVSAPNSYGWLYPSFGGYTLVSNTLKIDGIYISPDQPYIKCG